MEGSALHHSCFLKLGAWTYNSSSDCDEIACEFAQNNILKEKDLTSSSGEIQIYFQGNCIFLVLASLWLGTRKTSQYTERKINFFKEYTHRPCVLDCYNCTVSTLCGCTMLPKFTLPRSYT